MTLLASCAPTASATSMKDLLGGVSTLYLQTKDTTGNIKFSAPVILASVPDSFPRGLKKFG